MSGFYIKSITAHGSGKSDAIVSFGERLNIIQGYSDTGKTCIVKCIDFIFGSSEKPFDKSTGYSRVTMQIITPNGVMTLGRSIGKTRSMLRARFLILKTALTISDIKRSRRILLLTPCGLSC